MKKLALTFAIVLGISLCSFGQQYGGGMFRYGENPDPDQQEYFGYLQSDLFREGGLLNGLQLPSEFGDDENQGAPLGSGLFILAGLGAAYLVAKKRK